MELTRISHQIPAASVYITPPQALSLFIAFGVFQHAVLR